jgi:hypothetical protein
LPQDGDPDKGGSPRAELGVDPPNERVGVVHGRA